MAILLSRVWPVSLDRRGRTNSSNASWNGTLREIATGHVATDRAVASPVCLQCMYVCAYVYMYICMTVCPHIHKYISTDPHVHVLSLHRQTLDVLCPVPLASTVWCNSHDGPASSSPHAYMYVHTCIDEFSPSPLMPNNCIWAPAPTLCCAGGSTHPTPIFPAITSGLVSLHAVLQCCGLLAKWSPILLIASPINDAA